MGLVLGPSECGYLVPRYQWGYRRYSQLARGSSTDRQMVSIREALGKAKMNAWHVGELWHCLICMRRWDHKKSQAGGGQEDSGFQKVGTSVLARQALGETGAA